MEKQFIITQPCLYYYSYKIKRVQKTRIVQFVFIYSLCNKRSKEELPVLISSTLW